MALPIHEQFHSFQGEGFHAGRAAYFIRTYGCPVHCPWCDSAGTWHPDHKPETLERPEAEALARAAANSKAEFTVITGGEPAIHDLRTLTDALHAHGQPVHLETSGAFPLQGDFDWITLSPKRWKLPLPENIARANEIKIIVDTPDAIEEYVAVMGEALRHTIPVWLHPEWSKRDDGAILTAITEWVKTKGAPFRAGGQWHKYYAADSLDPRSADPVPLGGDPACGPST
ncbi:MAG: radical SAM protein [Verrucomicrobia bacterium]|nr:radical SAM protein [Verrucomicrobiota bacterium]